MADIDFETFNVWSNKTEEAAHDAIELIRKIELILTMIDALKKAHLEEGGQERLACLEKEYRTAAEMLTKLIGTNKEFQRLLSNYAQAQGEVGSIPTLAGTRAASDTEKAGAKAAPDTGRPVLNSGRKAGNEAGDVDSDAGENKHEEAGSVFCPYCGERIASGLKFCPKCGRMLNKKSASHSAQNHRDYDVEKEAGGWDDTAEFGCEERANPPVLGASRTSRTNRRTSGGNPYASLPGAAAPAGRAGSSGQNRKAEHSKSMNGSFFGRLLGKKPATHQTEQRTAPVQSGAHTERRTAPVQSGAHTGRRTAPVRNGARTGQEEDEVRIDRVEFSAVAPQSLAREQYSIVHVLMYEKEFRHVVDEMLEDEKEPKKETKGGVQKVREGSVIRVNLTSPDITVEDNEESRRWDGDYLDFGFSVMIPASFDRSNILFKASVYVNDLIATRLQFVVTCEAGSEQKPMVSRKDIMSAFISYASQDRNHVAAIVQGMQKARPDLDLFFDIESLRSGENWENALQKEISKRDVLFLCWSHYAKASKWVDREWRYAYEQKGADGIEPVPIESPDVCPPPEELHKKHFNDRLLYVIHSGDGF